MDRLHVSNLPEVRAVDKKFLGLPNDDGEPVIASIEVKKSAN